MNYLDWFFPTKKHLKYLRVNYPKYSSLELTGVLNKHFRRHLTQQQIKACLSRYKILCGRSGCFPKGNIPWNYGFGRMGLGIMHPNKTSFKKGNVPPNRRPLWSERVSKDNLIEIKVPQRNPHTGYATRFRHKHVYLWEKWHGPVPKGMCVAFRDSDNRNFSKKNLMLVSRAELLTLNQNGYKNVPKKIKPVVLTLSKLTTKRQSLQFSRYKYYRDLKKKKEEQKKLQELKNSKQYLHPWTTTVSTNQHVEWADGFVEIKKRRK